MQIAHVNNPENSDSDRNVEISSTDLYIKYLEYS